MVVVKKKLQMTLSYSITLLFQPIVLVLAEPVGLYHAKLIIIKTQLVKDIPLAEHRTQDILESKDGTLRCLLDRSAPL